MQIPTQLMDRNRQRQDRQTVRQTSSASLSMTEHKRSSQNYLNGELDQRDQVVGIRIASEMMTQHAYYKSFFPLPPIRSIM